MTPEFEIDSIKVKASAFKKSRKKRTPKLDIDTIKAEFAKNGDKLITRVYLGSKYPLLYKCGGCGRQRTVIYNNYYRGNANCLVCQARKKYNSNALLKKVTLRSQLLCTSEVCRIFDFEDGDFRNHVLKGLLPAPTKQIGSKVYYTEEDLEKIKDLVKL